MGVHDEELYAMHFDCEIEAYKSARDACIRHAQCA